MSIRKDFEKRHERTEIAAQWNGGFTDIVSSSHNIFKNFFLQGRSSSGIVWYRVQEQAELGGLIRP